MARSKINVQQVRYDAPAPAVRAEVGGDDGVTTDFHCWSHYEKDQVTYAGALTSPDGYAGDDVGVVRLGRPVLIWLVEWTALRVGLPPIVPDPAAPAGWRLLDEHVTPAVQGVGPSGADSVMRISGVYVYAKRKSSPSVFSDAVFPLALWVRDGAFARKIPPGNLSRTITQAGAGGGGGVLGGPVEVRFKAGG